MTMMVQITNLDANRTAAVEVQDFDIKRRVIALVEEIHLSPGESRSIGIHAARQIVVSEDPLATRAIESLSPTPSRDGSERA